MNKLHMSVKSMFVAGGLCLATTASATFPFFAEFLPAWTHVASACAVDEASLSKFASSGPNFTFMGTNISDIGRAPIPIIARCNVLNPLDGGNPQWSALIVGFDDPDATGAVHRVTAALRRVSRFTGSVSTVASFNSNGNNLLSNPSGRREALVQFNHNFDFEGNEYYVELGLTRTATSGNPVVYSARLTRAQPVPR